MNATQDDASGSCQACGRPVSSTARFCSGCGSAIPPVLPRRCAAPRELVAYRKHPQVIAAVVTFCMGLLLVRFLTLFWLPEGMNLGASGHESLRALQGVAIGFSLIYIILRQAEGDFRALFLIALALFIAEELFVFYADALWIQDFYALGIFMTFAASIFSALALIAAVYDPPNSDPLRKPLLVASSAILVTTVVRALGTIPVPNLDHLQNTLAIAVILGTMVYLVIFLFKPEPPQQTASYPCAAENSERAAMEDDPRMTPTPQAQPEPSTQTAQIPAQEPPTRSLSAETDETPPSPRTR